MVKDILIRLLFRLLDAGKEQTDDEIIIKWLSSQYGHPGFKQYIARRDKKFLKILAGGEGLQGETKIDYNLHLGQRFELLRLAQQAKLAHDKLNKNK